MKPSYDIIVKIRTPMGLADVGSFSLGTNLDFALTTFDSFKGETNDNHDAIIHHALRKKAANYLQGN